MAVRALLFDFDGLLVDTEGPSYEAWRALYAEHGHEFPLERWATLVGTLASPDGQAFDPIAHLGELTGTPLDPDATQLRRRMEKLQRCDDEGLRPGVAEYLTRAAELGLHTAVVSSSDEQWIDGHLTRVGAREGWGCLVCANHDAERAKPRPTLYLEALAELGVTAAEAVAFEDSPNGVRAAKAAGLYCVAVPNAVTRLLALDEADLVVDSLLDLPLDDLLARL